VNVYCKDYEPLALPRCNAVLLSLILWRCLCLAVDAVVRHVIADLYLDLDEERHVSDHQTCTSCYRCTMMLLRSEDVEDLKHIERKAEDCLAAAT